MKVSNILWKYEYYNKLRTCRTPLSITLIDINRYTFLHTNGFHWTKPSSLVWIPGTETQNKEGKKGKEGKGGMEEKKERERRREWENSKQKGFVDSKVERKGNLWSLGSPLYNIQNVRVVLLVIIFYCRWIINTVIDNNDSLRLVC